ncbi:MAG: hypothetical protein WKF71_17575 [Pyrinomonadaceae bacterium]
MLDSVHITGNSASNAGAACISLEAVRQPSSTRPSLPTPPLIAEALSTKPVF